MLCRTESEAHLVSSTDIPSFDDWVCVRSAPRNGRVARWRGIRWRGICRGIVDLPLGILGVHWIGHARNGWGIRGRRVHALGIWRIRVHGLGVWGILRGRRDLHLGLLCIGHWIRWTLRIFVGVFIILVNSFIYGIRTLCPRHISVRLLLCMSKGQRWGIWLTSKNMKAFPSPASGATARKFAMSSFEGNMVIRLRCAIERSTR
jgi:hypothetical protein